MTEHPPARRPPIRPANPGDVDGIVLPRDLRTLGMCYGEDEQGAPVPVTPESLQRVMDTWERASSTPPDVAELLHTSRTLVITSLAAYEQLQLALLVSLQAVEAALRARLQQEGVDTRDSNGRKLSWGALTDRARKHGLIPGRDQDDLWDVGRELRNLHSHPVRQPLATYAGTVPGVQTSHLLVARLFPAATGSASALAAVRCPGRLDGSREARHAGLHQAR